MITFKQSLIENNNDSEILDICEYQSIDFTITDYFDCFADEVHKVPNDLAARQGFKQNKWYMLWIKLYGNSVIKRRYGPVLNQSQKDSMESVLELYEQSDAHQLIALFKGRHGLPTDDVSPYSAFYSEVGYIETQAFKVVPIIAITNTESILITSSGKVVKIKPGAKFTPEELAS